MAKAEIIQPPVLLHNGNEEQSGSLEDLAALMQSPEGPGQREPTELETAVAGGLEEVTIPGLITLDDGTQFEAEAIRSWAWTPFGVYAVGRYVGEPDDIEKNVLFAGRKILSIELFVEAYKAFVDVIGEIQDEEQPEAEVVEDATPSD